MSCFGRGQRGEGKWLVTSDGFLWRKGFFGEWVRWSAATDTFMGQVLEQWNFGF